MLPLTAQIDGVNASDIIDGAPRVKLGQLDGRVRFRVSGDAKSDGTPDRVMHSWLVRGKKGQMITLTATHQRAGTAVASVVLP